MIFNIYSLEKCFEEEFIVFLVPACDDDRHIV